MRVRNNKTLDLFRGAGRCEICGKSCRQREPHHVNPRGLGGGGQLDIRINLIALGNTQLFECDCHTKCGAAKIKRDEVVAIIAKREKTTPEDIQAVVDLFRRTTRDSAFVLDGMTDSAIGLFRKTMGEPR